MYGLCDRSKLSRILVQWGWEKEKFNIVWRVAEKQISETIHNEGKSYICIPYLSTALLG